MPLPPPMAFTVALFQPCFSRTPCISFTSLRFRSVVLRAEHSHVRAQTAFAATSNPGRPGAAVRFMRAPLGKYGGHANA
eukprot:3900955-Alexandrium_andersonii.AAC.1